MAVGDRVVVLWRFRAQGHGGDSVDLPAVSIYRLRDGKIIESRCSTLIPCSSIASSRRNDDLGEPGRRTDDGRQRIESGIGNLTIRPLVLRRPSSVSLLTNRK
jgi:SnoaL-like domain